MLPTDQKFLDFIALEYKTLMELHFEFNRHLTY